MVTMSDRRGVVRVAAVGDLHCTAASRGSFRGLFEQISEQADVLALCGDITQAGKVDETQVLARELREWLRIPAMAVLGNHDVEAGCGEEVCRMLREAGVQVLDGQSCEVCGVGFAGTKGFGGGFHGKMLLGWGEPCIKLFVSEAVHEARKLDAALSQISPGMNKIALLHYAPIRATVVNESPEIYPFVGSSHLEAPLNRHRVVAAFHGHAHHGTPEGRTSSGVPVYNVCESLMRRTHQGRPFALVEVPLHPQEQVAVRQHEAEPARR